MKYGVMAKPKPDPVVQKRVGDNLALARGRRSQREIAAASGLELSTINRIEKGKINPSLATLSAIAEAVGVSIESLLGPSMAPSFSPTPPANAPARLLLVAKRVDALTRLVLRTFGDRVTAEELAALQGEPTTQFPQPQREDS